MGYKFNIYASFPTPSSLTEGLFQREHFGGGIEKVRGCEKVCRSNEWLYKLAAPYQPFERRSRINLIWRVARFVFEGPLVVLAADRIPRGCWWWRCRATSIPVIFVIETTLARNQDNAVRRYNATSALYPIHPSAR